MVMPIFVSWDMPIFGLDYRSGGSASLKLDDEAMSNSAQVFSRHPPVADRRHCVLTSSSRIYLTAQGELRHGMGALTSRFER